MDNRDNYIPLKEAKNVIMTALDQFDPELAVRAANILYDEKRLNIVEVARSKTNMMQCRPAGLTIEDVKAADMHIPGFSEKFGPHFTRQDNPADYSIIDFEYDGSPRAIVWLGHELGHAIADDVQRENGHSFKDFSSAEMEEQAYFVQHIVSQHLKNDVKTPKVQDKDLGQDVLQMSWNRATQYTKAGTVFESALAHSANEREAIILEALDQRLG